MCHQLRKFFNLPGLMLIWVLFAGSATADFTLPILITADNSVNTTTTVMGLENALVGLDSYDQWTAPPGPGLAIYMYAPQVSFYLEADAQPWIAPYQTPVRWQISIRNSTETLCLSWDASQLPEISGGRFLLSNTRDGVVDMQSQAIAYVNAGDANLYVDYSWSPNLPVELYGFSAQANNGAVLLSWKTALEENLLGFRILRATTSAGDYAPVNSELISAKGIYGSDNQYVFRDRPEPMQSTWYYKVQAVDRDGSISLYGPVACRTGMIADFLLEQNYPNPFSTATQIGFFLPVAVPVHAAIYNIRGQLVQVVIDRQMQAGYHAVRFAMNPDLHGAFGVYRFEMTAGSVRQSRNFVYTGR